MEETERKPEEHLLQCPFCGGIPKITQKGRNGLTLKCASCLNPLDINLHFTL